MRNVTARNERWGVPLHDDECSLRLALDMKSCIIYLPEKVSPTCTVNRARGTHASFLATQVSRVLHAEVTDLNVLLANWYREMFSWAYLTPISISLRQCWNDLSIALFLCNFSFHSAESLKTQLEEGHIRSVIGQHCYNSVLCARVRHKLKSVQHRGCSKVRKKAEAIWWSVLLWRGIAIYL